MTSVLDAPLLRPMVGLCLWTFIIETWMGFNRLPAVTEFNIEIRPELTNEEFRSKIPPSYRWKTENYNHLHEQPTVYYAVVLGLTFLGDRSDLSATLAWGYLGLRVVHSLVQVIANIIPWRLRLFMLSSLVLFGMTVRLAQLVF